MPSVSRVQQKAMHAAAEGRGNIGIPVKVAKEFNQADVHKTKLRKRGLISDKVARRRKI